MQSTRFVAYYRVSTQKQGNSGLGLEAQEEAVGRFVSTVHGSIIETFTEIETGKGANALAKRPRLRQALEACRKQGATLVIAKLDRLARNVHFVSGLMEARVRFVACDLPEANELTLHVMAAFAEHEAKRISERTKEALARAKARGVQLGRAGPANLKINNEARRAAAGAFCKKLCGTVEGFRLRGLTQRQMRDELHRLGVSTYRGGEWSLHQLQRLLKALDATKLAT